MFLKTQFSELIKYYLVLYLQLIEIYFSAEMYESCYKVLAILIRCFVMTLVIELSSSMERRISMEFQSKSKSRMIFPGFLEFPLSGFSTRLVCN